MATQSSDDELSDDSLNMQDLDTIEVSVANDSDIDLSSTAHAVSGVTKDSRAVSQDCSSILSQLSSMRESLSRVVADYEENQCSSENSLGLLSDSKLDELDNNNDFLGITQCNSTCSPGSDKENRQQEYDSKKAAVLFATPAIQKLRNGAQISSVKKVSFNEEVVETSFMTNTNTSGDESMVFNEVCSLPSFGESRVEDESSATPGANFSTPLVDVTRLGSNGSIKTDSDTTLVSEKLKQFPKIPLGFSIDQTQPFSDSDSSPTDCFNSKSQVAESGSGDVNSFSFPAVDGGAQGLHESDFLSPGNFFKELDKEDIFPAIRSDASEQEIDFSSYANGDASEVMSVFAKTKTCSVSLMECDKSQDETTNRADKRVSPKCNENAGGDESEAESEHAISLKTIKETWPTLSDNMSSKQIADVFIDLMNHAPVPSEEQEREKTPKDFPLLGVSIVSEFRDLSEYPIQSDMSSFMPDESVFTSRVSISDLSEDLKMDQPALLGNDISQISSVVSQEDSSGSKKHRRGLSFSTPKAKNVLEGTLELLGEASTNKFLDEKSRQEFVDDNNNAGENGAYTESQCADSFSLPSIHNSTDFDATLKNTSKSDIVGGSQILRNVPFDDNNPLLSRSTASSADSSRSPVPSVAQLVDGGKNILAKPTIADSDIRLRMLNPFETTIKDFTSQAEVEVENLTDSWVVAKISIENPTHNETVVSDFTAFKVRSPVICGPQLTQSFTVNFLPSDIGVFEANLIMSVQAINGKDNLEKMLLLHAKATVPELAFYHSGEYIEELSWKYNEGDEASEVEIDVEWRCEAEGKVSLTSICSIEGALLFYRTDGQGMIDETDTVFLSPSQDMHVNKNTLRLKFRPSLEKFNFSMVNAHIKALVQTDQKKKHICSLPVNIEVIRKNLDIAEKFRNLVFSCDNQWTQEVSIRSKSKTATNVVIRLDSSMFCAEPSSFFLKPLHQQKVLISALHVNFQRNCDTQMIILANDCTEFESVLSIVVPVVSDKKSLTFNRKCIFFSCPFLDYYSCEDLKMRNNALVPLKLSISVQDCSYFSVVAKESEKEDEFHVKSTVLPGKSEKIQVKFSSPSTLFRSSVLTLRIADSLLKWVIPLYGYAGASKVVASVLSMSPAEDQIDVQLRNEGTQDALFVVTSDHEVSPNSGVVPVGSDKLITVKASGSGEPLNDLEVTWGDAILRQLYSVCQTNSWKPLPSYVQRFCSIDISDLPSHETLPTHLNLSSSFLNNVTTSAFDLCQRPANISMSERSSSVISDSHSSDRTVLEQSTQFLRINPEKLVFSGPIQTFIMQNVAAHQIKFTVASPDSVSVNPSRGILKSNNEIMVEVRREKSASKLPDDKLCILFESSILQVPMEFLPEVDGSDACSVRARENFVTLVNESLHFPDAKVGDCVQSVLTFTNNLSDRVKWVISSVAPTFVRSVDNDLFRARYSVFRVERSVGYLGGKEMIDLPVEFVPMDVGSYSQHWELQITPLVANAPTSKCIRLSFHGAGIRTRKSLTSRELTSNVVQVDRYVSDSPPTHRGVCARRTDQLDAFVPRKKPVIRVDTNKLVFPDIISGRKEKMLLRIKNCDKRAHTVKFLWPSAPFHVDHHSYTISGGHFIRLPVCARFGSATTPAGHHSSVLVIKCESANVTIAIQLFVCCK